MIIIIEGMNRTEFCKPKGKDVDRRHFYATRSMLYRAYPNQFTRMRIRQFGIETGTEEVIIYPENSIHADVERNVHMTVDKMLADIDENKILAGNSLNKRSWGVLSSKNMSKLWNALPMLIAGVVLLYAFAANGFQM